MNLIQIQNETRKNVIADFEQSLRNKVEIMAVKRMQEELQPHSVKWMKVMVMDKILENFRRRRLDSHDFLI